MRRLRVAARSASSCSCAAASSGSAIACGEVFEQTSISGAPSACIRSNLRSARSRLRSEQRRRACPRSRGTAGRGRCARPRSAHHRARARAPTPLKWMKSFSKSSMPSKRAAAMASSFSRSVPLSDTVAMARRMASVPRRLSIGSARPRAARRVSPSRSRRTRGRPESSRTACRCRPGSGSPCPAPPRRNGVNSRFITTSPTNVLGRDPVDVERQRVAVLHAERRGVDDEVVAGRIVRAGLDRQCGIVRAQPVARAPRPLPALVSNSAISRDARRGERRSDRRADAAGARRPARARRRARTPCARTPRTKPAPSNWSPSSVPSARLQDRVAGAGDRAGGRHLVDAAPTVVTLCGIVTSAPRMLRQAEQRPQERRGSPRPARPSARRRRRCRSCRTRGCRSSAP